MKKKYLEIDLKLQKSHSNYDVLCNYYKDLKNLSNRRGYYESTLNFIDPEGKKNGQKGEPYTCNLYVKELDRYTNGMSKIELTSIELISGYDNSFFEHVKNSMKNKFSSLKKTTEIEWLESEESLKDIRKKKLERIIEIEKEN